MGNSMKQNSNQNHFQQLFFSYFSPSDEFDYKNGNGRQNRSSGPPWVPKLGYKGGRVPQLSSLGPLASSGAGVVCHVPFPPPLIGVMSSFSYRPPLHCSYHKHDCEVHSKSGFKGIINKEVCGISDQIGSDRGKHGCHQKSTNRRFCNFKLQIKLKCI